MGYSFILFDIYMEISSRQFHLGKFGHTQKGANGSLVRTARNNEVQSPPLSVHVSSLFRGTQRPFSGK